MRETKECLECGGIYFRSEHVTEAQWEARKYCSPSCAGRAASARRHKEKEAEPIKTFQEVVDEGEPHFLPLDPVAAQTVTKTPEMSPLGEKLPVMRELRIVRIGPNPRMVVCEYFELAQRRTCTVMVKRTQKFVRGMRFTMAEPVSEEAYRRPWVYEGKPPRWRGRW